MRVSSLMHSLRELWDHQSPWIRCVQAEAGQIAESMSLAVPTTFDGFMAFMADSRPTFVNM